MDCVNCGEDVEDFEPEYCCSGHECGCQGSYINGPCVCSDECYEEFMKPAPVVVLPIKIRAIELNNLNHNICASPMKQCSINIKTDREPNFLYERIGNSFFAEDSGFVNTYEYVSGSTDGFAGREINLPMKDGSVFETKGSLWSSAKADGVYENHANTKLYHVGQSSDASYRKCPVYCSSAITEEILNELIPNFQLRNAESS